MPERVLNLQLNGNEVVEAILFEIRTQLQKSCYLNPNSAYDWMSAKVRVDLELHDTGMLITETFTAESDTGTKPQDAETIEGYEVEFDVEPAPPNEVRVQTSQPVPVEAKDKDGRPVIKGVRYAKKDAKKVGAVALALLLFAGLGMVRAQQPASQPAAAPQQEQLSYAEQIAVMATLELTQKAQEQNQKAVQQVRALMEDISKHHPGYHMNAQTVQLEKDAPVAGPPPLGEKSK